MARPDLSLVPAYFHNYINQVLGDDLIPAFQKESPEMFQFIERIPAEKYDYRYAEDKWTLREVLQHLVDAERVFAYRALRFARKDSTPLPGFDENIYAVTSKADRRSWEDLTDEFKAVRKSSEYLFRSFDEDQLNATGISSNKSITVIGLGYVIIGHPIHHMNIIRQRYL